MIDTKIKRQYLPIPSEKDPLFVSKNIYSYKQLPTSTSNEMYHKNIKEGAKKIYPDITTNLNHQREIKGELTYDELSNIKISTNVIDFGVVNVKSREARYFWVKNNSKKIVSINLAISDP